ncbi:hypothetical protein [Aureimonas phyllosphaerae]|uniref:Antitoxin ChpS n=1 Tax=Aureimonas phyllosphaerae TaxID=1166078 RepID=A0A7W6BU60_9HYPH|nr:hypothetical protein [Aureimonas phyllosphaerae]MBB3938089.1 antitoxin ChpS [Aureimonas phyllosphaerae]MBB3962096.1 antitoxin ChpS [Aureimonas phyllosphaerae]SFF56021.1 antitoxin ChpS [Aureimonas phyllosphaerae]
MAVAHLRRSGGSRIMTMPASVVERAEKSGFMLDSVDVDFDELSKRIVIVSIKPRYKLEDLLAQCDPDAPLTAEEEAWFADGPMGSEEI